MGINKLNMKTFAAAIFAAVASAAVNQLDWNAQFGAKDKSSTFEGDVEFNWVDHDVYEMADKEAFDKCSFTGSKNLGARTGVTVSADVGKTKYYSCSKYRHCENGQKVAITWTGAVPTPAKKASRQGERKSDVDMMMEQDCKNVTEDLLKRCETAFKSAMENGLENAFTKRDIENARRQCKEQSRNAEEARNKAQAVISDVQKYCSNKGNDNMKQGIDWMAGMVGQRCRSRSGASALLMSASAIAISSAMLF